ncbi:hypothetical protein [Methylobacterium durans]|uniref:General secretion pathway protein GspJ n=1 Tax=Methylobacterium durans TaxID=2202825 RepID=A0A2U8WDW1_9HYPH|nr:hypothetical protein [Methylobacterium durans]AWN43731.1 hypothetical protein DK389_28470 [Methylobacterium durans]
MSAPSRRQQGFVIAEALVALLLLALTLGLAANVFSFGRRIAQAGQGRDVLARTVAGSGALGGWLAAAAPIRTVTPTGPGPVLFEGRPDRLTFVTASRGDVQPAGLLAVTVGFNGRDRDARTGSILFDVAPLAVGEALLPDQVAREPLIARVAAARFRYFGALAEDRPAAWYDDWTDATRLPELVQLRANLDLGGRIEPLDLSFRLPGS